VIGLRPDDLTEHGELRCPVCIGPAGDDSRRCERPALPRHRLHLVDGLSHLPGNEAEVEAGAAAWIAERVPGL
jgi:hypothetical protein